MWTSNRMIAVYIAVGLVAACVTAWLVLRKTVRTRLRMEKTMRQDPDINDWLIIFNWTTKILYGPAIIASLLASLLMFLREAGWIFGHISPELVGGVWFAIVFVNLLVEEYSISVKVLIITVVSAGFLLLWLHLLGWVVPFLRIFRRLALSMSATGFLLVTVIGVLVIFISWLKGLFYYVTITPNYMNIQEGPTESGKHIGREDYNTVVDTSDFLERLMGFGRIVIIFKDIQKHPLVLLVWRINKKAQLLERVRGKFAIDFDERQSRFQKEMSNQAKPVL
ncbi:MAG TPA: hypothetical protein VMW16_16785 [Sedimentisphaerales bacterium]|nr:hypothetical protein [Sedimentisphaerales bacterium]